MEHGFPFVKRGRDHPQISVVIPCHNYGAYVGEAIESILDQTLPQNQREVIVVDDSSSDNSWSVISRYVGKHLSAIRHERNTGHIRTYHDGMTRATGEAIVLLSADDLAIDRDALRLQFDTLESHPEVGLVFSDFMVIDADGRRVAERDIDAAPLIPGPEGFRRLLFENFIQHSGTMVRREQFEATGGYDTRLFHSVDWELWLRVSARSDLAHVRRRLYAYRVHRRNMHGTSGYENSIREVEKVLELATAYGPPSTRELVPRALASHYVGRAGVYLRQRRYRRAVADMTAAFTKDPRTLASLGLARGLVSGVLSLAQRRPAERT